MIIIKTEKDNKVKSFHLYVPENLKYAFWAKGDTLYVDSSALKLHFSTYGFIPIATKGERLSIKKITKISKKLRVKFIILGQKIRIIGGNNEQKQIVKRNRRENQTI